MKLTVGPFQNYDVVIWKDLFGTFRNYHTAVTKYFNNKNINLNWICLI